MDFFSRALDAEYKSKGIIIQVSENGSTLELIVSYHGSQFISQDYVNFFIIYDCYFVKYVYTCHSDLHLLNCSSSGLFLTECAAILCDDQTEQDQEGHY